MGYPSKSLGPFLAKIDRPKGYTKKWGPSPDYPDGRTWTYPVDYGFFLGRKGEDGEGLDVFMGDDPEAHLESFLKLKPDATGKFVPDETKFLLGVTAAERKKIYAFYGDEVSDKKVYADHAAAQAAIDAFKPARKSRYKADTAKAASLRALLDTARIYGVKIGTLQGLLGGTELFDDTGDQASPAHLHLAERAAQLDHLQSAFGRADRQPDSMGHDENALGMMPMEGMLA